jgi:esterase/lipase superfamily enzyme
MRTALLGLLLAALLATTLSACGRAAEERRTEPPATTPKSAPGVFPETAPETAPDTAPPTLPEATEPPTYGTSEVRGPEPTAPPEGPAPTPRPPPRDRPDTVRVFYATDRAPFTPTLSFYLGQLRWPLGVLVAGWLVLRGLGRMIRDEYRRMLVVLRVVGALALAALLVDAGYTILSVSQAHDRLGLLYGDERLRPVVGATSRGPLDGVLALGACDVTIPPGHALGQVERPSPWRGDLFEDPQRHMVVLAVETRGDEAFFREVDERIAESDARDAFVFVHGYNVSFQEAVLRTAQIAYDLEFRGAPICYSWPSQGDVAQYFVDEANVGWTVPHLERFLLALKERTQAARIHLIAHSMGNRALADALARIVLERRGAEPLFQEVVLAAPDIDAETFRDFLVPALLPAGRRVTLYASSKDKALQVSSELHGSARAGESGDHLVVVEGMDTIDVSRVSGSHSYIGNNDRVLGDLGGLLLHDRRLIEGPGVLAGWLGEVRYWILRQVGR